KIRESATRHSPAQSSRISEFRAALAVPGQRQPRPERKLKPPLRLRRPLAGTKRVSSGKCFTKCLGCSYRVGCCNCITEQSYTRRKSRYNTQCESSAAQGRC